MALIEEVLQDFNKKIRAINQRISDAERERSELYKQATVTSGIVRPCEISLTDEYNQIQPYAVGVPKPEQGGSLKEILHMRCAALSKRDAELIQIIKSAKEEKTQLRSDLDFQLQKLGFNSQQAAAAAAEALSTVEKETESEKKYNETIRLIVKLTGIGLVILIFYYIFNKLSKQKSK
jgi:hypothetical protein